MGVGLELEGPFQLLNSVALIPVVAFQTQEWGQSGLCFQHTAVVRRGPQGVEVCERAAPLTEGVDLGRQRWREGWGPCRRQACPV